MLSESLCDVAAPHSQHYMAPALVQHQSSWLDISLTFAARSPRDLSRRLTLSKARFQPAFSATLFSPYSDTFCPLLTLLSRTLASSSDFAFLS